MTTQRQVDKLLKPLLERHDDLIQVKRWVYLKPIRHVVRGILIERISSAAQFRLWWAVVNLCEPYERVPLNWATWAWPKTPGMWRWDDPLLQEKFIEIVEEEALPGLKAIETLDDFYEFASSPEHFSATYFSSYHLRTVGVDIARGRLDAARSTCEELIEGRTKWNLAIMPEEFERITGQLCPLLAADDYEGMARLLHEWEAYTAEKLGITDIWEPTPFPLEEQMRGR